ncbi:MAG: transglycosylase SLT domain-containing protein [Thermoanaerobaculia bacterium]
MLWALAFALLQTASAAPSADLTSRLVDLRLAGRDRAALQLLDDSVDVRTLAPAPAFLRADLLERTGHLEEAHQAFVSLLSTDLAAFARFRLARLQWRLGHPEVAAGLLATLLADGPPTGLDEPAARLFSRTLAAGGDCRLAEGAERWDLAEADARRLTLARADCRLGAGDEAGGRALLRSLLDGDLVEGQALGAAERLLALEDGRLDRGLARQIGLALYNQRSFEAALAPLRTAAREAPTSWEVHYAVARSLFWLARYDEAVESFEGLLAVARTGEQRADALFQQGRCHELAGHWSAAITSYRRADEAEPQGGWAAASLLARVRLVWRQGDEAGALTLYDRLGERGSWRETKAQTEIFLAASDLVRRRADRAALWLDRAAAHSEPEEIEYWRGRLAELEGRQAEAVRHYGAVLTENAYGPFATAARERLAAPLLDPLRQEEARRLLAGGTDRALLTAWLLTGDEDPAGATARDRLRAALSRDREARAALTVRSLPPPSWPAAPAQGGPASRLAAVGLWTLDPEGLRDRFPLNDPELALTRAAILAADGDVNGSLHAAEVLQKRLPDGVAPALLAEELQHRLYPRPWTEVVEREAAAHGVDPWLLYGLMREESRFDPDAVSAAAARGLTQFVLPTARRYAGATARAALTAEDLHEPEVAIALGAAYLGDLTRHFAGREWAILAAYNAGENQADLWQSYCHSREAAEYLSKIGFRQTRDYVRRVLTSRERYRALYGGR